MKDIDNRIEHNVSHFIGFENWNNKNKNSHDKYPPYNIERIGNSLFKIEIAVAGFPIKKLNVTLDGQYLIITGSAQESSLDNTTPVHIGIAKRPFSKVFLLAENIEPIETSYSLGLLTVLLWQKQYLGYKTQIPISNKDLSLLHSNTTSTMKNDNLIKSLQNDLPISTINSHANDE